MFNKLTIKFFGYCSLIVISFLSFSCSDTADSSVSFINFPIGTPSAITPSAPVLASPANGATDVTIPATLSWNASTGAGSYTLQTSEDSNFTVIMNYVGITTLTLQTSNLGNSKKYYWRVSATNSTGTSNYSSVWTFTTKTVSSSITMIQVTGGTFTMGETGYATPLHQVTLSSYYISRTEVTQGQYKDVMGTNPSYFSTTVGPTGPVEQVTWYNCISFCNKLSINEGRTPCYSINGNTAPTDWTSGTIVCDWAKTGYRLPTEAEWEYAARGGSSSQNCTYSGSNTVNEVAWNTNNSPNTTNVVGGKKANELGIVDMSGNVWEWCWDWYAAYSATAQTNPTGPTNPELNRVLRGGAWSVNVSDCRVSYRSGTVPSDKNYGGGFRVVRL